MITSCYLIESFKSEEQTNEIQEKNILSKVI